MGGAGTVGAAAAAAVLLVAGISAVLVRRRGLAGVSGASARDAPRARTPAVPAAPRSRAGAPGPVEGSRDFDDAVNWAIRHLPGQVTHQLSPEDIRRIIGWNLDYFRSRETSGNGHSPRGHGPVVVAGAEAVAWVLDRAGASGRSYTAAQVHAVLEVQMTYLEALGAVDPDPPA